MSKPKLFIGSSVAGLPIARAIQAELEYDMESQNMGSRGI